MVTRLLRAEGEALEAARQAMADQAAVDAIRVEQGCRHRQACRVYLQRQYAKRRPKRRLPPNIRELYTFEKKLRRARKLLEKK